MPSLRMIFRSVLRKPVERRFVFIITYGRSGSTLLMNLINSCEGCCVRGENNAALYSIYQSYRKLTDAKKDYGKNAHLISSPWYGIDNVDVSSYGASLARAFVDEVIKPARNEFLCGFKEIRHSVNEVPDLSGYINFILEFFPESKIIFNHRDIRDVAVSKWWASMPNALDKLREMEERFDEFPNSKFILHFSYNKAISEISHVEKMFEFLNIPFDEPSVQEVFSRRHSY